jgi:hypothetical protein
LKKEVRLVAVAKSMTGITSGALELLNRERDRLLDRWLTEPNSRLVILMEIMDLEEEIARVKKTLAAESTIVEITPAAATL